nr:ribonuclease H-like domain-containing protein [Tanacetum cinerariifolium]
MRIEQYFLMTDYSLWEVILNGDSLIPTRVIEGVVQPVAPTTAEQRLARKNKLKAREKRFGGNKETKKVQKTLLKQQYENFTGLSFESLDQIHDRLQKLISQLEILKESLSQEDINLKFLRSLPTEWRTYTLIWKNKTDLEDQRLDYLFNSLKIYEAEVQSSSSASTSTQNIAFVSSQNTDSTNEPVSAVASFFAASAKVPVFALPNVDTLSNAIIYSFFASQSNSPQLDNDDLKQINTDDLEEMDLKWQMAMLISATTATGKGTLQGSAGHLRTQGGIYDWSFQAEEEPTNYALMAFTSSSSSSYDNELRDNALVVLRQKFEKAEQDRDELKLKLGKFQTSSKNLSQLLASQTNDKTRLGYNNQVFTSFMFDCDEMFSYKSDVSMPASPVYNRYQSGEWSSAPIIEDWVSDSEDESEADPSQNYPSFVQPTEQVKTLRPFVKPVEHSILTVNHKTDIPKPKRHGNNKNILTKSKLVPITAARPVTTAVPHNNVTRPRPAKTIVTKPHSPPRRNINRRPSPKPSNFPQKVTTAKVAQVNAVKGVQGNWGGKINGKGKIRTEKLDFDDVYFVKELKFNLFSVSQMCDKKNNVLFTDTGCIVLSPEFKLLDKNQVLLRVPRENNMYNVDLKNIVPSRDLTCLFAKATLDESNL